MRLLMAAMILLLVAGAAGADEGTGCTDKSAGMVACIAGVLCSCAPGRDDASLGLKAGFHWDCGILRPHCGPAGDPPATLAPWPYALPPGLSLGDPHPILQHRGHRHRPWWRSGAMEDGP